MDNFIEMKFSDGRVVKIECSYEEELELAAERMNEATEELIALPFYRVFKRNELLSRIEWCAQHIEDVCKALIKSHEQK